MLDNVKSPFEMIRILPDEKYNEAVKFINLGEELGCKAATRYAHCNKYWRCVFSRKKPSRVLFTVECTEDWWRLKACLWNIDAYRELLDSCGEKIKTGIVNAHDCKFCNSHCKGGAGFTFENKQYQKCVGCCFYFKNLREEDLDSLVMFIKKEHEASCSG